MLFIFIVNFEQVSRFADVSIADFEQMPAAL